MQWEELVAGSCVETPVMSSFPRTYNGRAGDEDESGDVFILPRITEFHFSWQKKWRQKQGGNLFLSPFFLPASFLEMR